MPAPGETDLDALLAGLTVARRPGRFTMIETEADERDFAGDSEATVREGATTSHVVSTEDAIEAGFDVPVELAWLTLTVESSLEAVGLTAHVSTALAARGIPCNVLAGLRHDHLLVPTGMADEAIAVLADSVR